MDEKENAPQTAQKPERERLRPRNTGGHLRLRNWLNIVFMLAAIAGVALYIKSPATLFGLSLGGLLIGFAILVKAAEVVLRIIK